MLEAIKIEEVIFPTLKPVQLLTDLEKKKEVKPPDLTPRASGGEFKQVSLKRFSVKGPVGAARPPKQEVKAAGVEQRLDTLIDITKMKPGTATLR